MKTKIFLILAAVMGGAGLAAIGTAMLVQVFRTSAPATTTAAGAPPTAAYTEPRQPETEQSPAKLERTSSGEKTVSVTAPDYLRPQSAASALLQPAITTEPATATATQPVATEPSAAQPAAAAQVAQSLPAESATAVVGSVASSAVYVQDVSELAQPSYTPEPLPVDDSDSYRYFYQQLAPLGEWLYISGHGYCWRPAGVSGDWRPYWDGHWAWSECGWTWVSSEPWGGSTYHYGRWMLTSGYGWVWVPGRQWAPAWVCWRHGPGFVGWAPLPPGALSGAAFYREAIGLGVGCWTMVHERDFLAPRCATVALPAHRCAELMPRTTHVTGVRFVHNVVMNTGPAHRHMEQVAGRPLPPMRLRGREATFDDMRTRVESGAVIVARPPPPGSGMPALDESKFRRVPPIAPTAGRPESISLSPGQPPDKYRTRITPPPSSSPQEAFVPVEAPVGVTRPTTEPRPPEPSRFGRTDAMPSGPPSVFRPSGQQPPQRPQRFDEQMRPPSGVTSPTEVIGQTRPPQPAKSDRTDAMPSGPQGMFGPSEQQPQRPRRFDEQMRPPTRVTLPTELGDQTPSLPQPHKRPSRDTSSQPGGMTLPEPPRRADSTVTPQGPSPDFPPSSSTRRPTQQTIDGPPVGPFGGQPPAGRSEPTRRGPTSRTLPPSGMDQPPGGTTVTPPTRRADSTVTPQGPPSGPPSSSSSRFGRPKLDTELPPLTPPTSDRSTGPSSRTRQLPTIIQPPSGPLSRSSGAPPSTPRVTTSSKGPPPSGGQNVPPQSSSKRGKKPPTDETTPPPR